MDAHWTEAEFHPVGDHVEPTIPVLRPCLPSAEQLLPYLRRIDATRIYTSWGPLALELEERLCRRFSLPLGGVASAGSGTSALTAAILAVAPGRAAGRRRLAIVPALTFVATAAAAESCGCTLRIADVDSETWQLDPERVAARADLDEVAIVIPVAPFGRPVPQTTWLEFRQQTGIPVVIDGAATFETATGQEGILGELPVAMSFHATKAFATGEGGCVASTETGLVEQIGQALNFGFSGSRDSATPSLNGKLSEYHAAVGLAELEGWNAKQEATARVLDLYRERFNRLGLQDRLVCAPEVASLYVLFRAETQREANNVAASLAENRVSHRLWYGGGLQTHTHFAGCLSDPLPVTEELAPRLLGLPFALD